MRRRRGYLLLVLALVFAVSTPLMARSMLGEDEYRMCLERFALYVALPLALMLWASSLLRPTWARGPSSRLVWVAWVCLLIGGVCGLAGVSGAVGGRWRVALAYACLAGGCAAIVIGQDTLRTLRRPPGH